MSKKICLFFTVLFLTIFCFIGCSDLINIKTHTDIKFDLDLSKIIKSTRNNEELLEDDSTKLTQEFELKVSLYNANNFNVETQDVQNLLLITENRVKINNGIANVKFENISIGLNVIIFADLYEVSNSGVELKEDLKLIYSGGSSVFTIKQDFNKVNVVLKKVQMEDDEDLSDDKEEPVPEDKPDVGDEPEVDNPPESGEKPNPEDSPVVEPEIPTILNQPENILKVFATEAESNGIKNAQLSCSAFVTDGGTLSFDWYYVDEDENLWIAEDDTETINNIGKTSTISVDANLGETKIFYCVVTNTIGDKFVTVQSNLITVAFVVGKFDSFSAKYIGEYEFYGLDSNKILENIEITEYYKDEYDNIATLTYNNPSEEKYDCKISAGFESYIGYVPFIITELSLNKTKEITIPVKYQLDVDNLDLELWYNKDDTTNSIQFIPSDSNSIIYVPQYVTTFNYQYIDEVLPAYVKESETDIGVPFSLDGFTNISAISKNDNIAISNGDLLNNVGNHTYSLTISSNSGIDEWFAAKSVSKEFNVKVCPWKINFTSVDTNNLVSAENLIAGKDYYLSISNEAWQPDNDVFTITFEGDGVTENTLSVPYSGETTISAIYSEKIIASVDIKVEPLVVQTPTIVNQPQSKIEVYDADTCPSVSTDLSCSASVDDGGTLSFEWYYKTNDTGDFEKYTTQSTETNNNNVVTSTISVQANQGEIKYLYCVVTNSIGGSEKSIQSNTATVACSEGVLTSWSVNYIGTNEVWGSDTVSNNIQITEIYKDNLSVEETEVSFTNSDKYSISINETQKNYIGYVEYQVTNISQNTTNTVEVPVKYQLESDKFEYKFAYTVDENIIFDLTDNVFVPQYFTNLSYEYISDLKPTRIRDESGTLSDFVITDNLDMSVSSENGNSFDTVATCVYSVSISPQETFAWLIGSANKDFNVQVCPWQIKFKDSTGSDVSVSQITSGQTYTINISNDALSPNYVLPSVTFSGQGVNGTVFTLPESGSSTIYANSNGKELAIIEVAPVLVTIDVTLPTYPDIEGLSNPEIDGSFVTFTVENIYESYEWYVDDVLQDSSDYIFTLDTDNMLGGIYSIMLIVTDVDGNHFSAEYQLEMRK